MMNHRIPAWFTAFRQATLPTFERPPGSQADLHTLAGQQAALPRFVRQDPLAMRYLGLLGPLAWDQFSERDLRVQCGIAPVPYAPFVAACLVKLDQGLASMGDLHRFLVEHPPLLWLLGFPLRPDAAYDAFYVYERFHAAGGFAAVPLAARGGRAQRHFDPDGLPLCQVGLAMSLKQTFLCRTPLVTHQRGRHACPLLYPQRTGQVCPIGHKHWAKKGCVTTLATSVGTRQ